MPNRILIVRHGESKGNINHDVYKDTPDYAVKLTDAGKQQAFGAGDQIGNIIQSESYGVYYSPYFRSRQTMDCALTKLDTSLCKFQREEVRLREQEYCGRLYDGYEKHLLDDARNKYGKFFYRMDGGESGADVFDRVSDFLSTLNRDFEKPHYPLNTLIFAHGMTNRIFIMRFFHITVEEFETWKNPHNGQIYVLELQKNNKYRLLTPIEKHERGYGMTYSDE